jgi:hypothetical protein
MGISAALRAAARPSPSCRASSGDFGAIRVAGVAGRTAERPNCSLRSHRTCSFIDCQASSQRQTGAGHRGQPINTPGACAASRKRHKNGCCHRTSIHSVKVHSPSGGSGSRSALSGRSSLAPEFPDCGHRASSEGWRVSGRQSHRGKSRSPVAWVAGSREIEIVKPTDKCHLRRARNRRGLGWVEWSTSRLYGAFGLFNGYHVRSDLPMALRVHLVS